MKYFVCLVIFVFSLQGYLAFANVSNRILLAPEEKSKNQPTLTTNLSFNFSNRPKDIEALKESAQNGDSESIRLLAMEYYHGNLLEKDWNKALELLSDAAKKGNEYAKKQHLEVSEKLRAKLAVENIKEVEGKAEKGDASAAYDLGLAFLHGFGVEKNEAKAFVYFEKASEKNVGAQFYLGDLYYWGKGCSKNFVEARKWYEKAAAGKNAAACGRLGEIYRKGEGVDANIKESIKFYRLGARRGDDNSQLNLGLAYFHGTGVKKNTKQAIAWLERAANQGNGNACMNLYLIYSDILDDKNKAMESLKKGANFKDKACIDAYIAQSIAHKISEESRAQKADLEAKYKAGDMRAAFDFAKLFSKTEEGETSLELFEKCANAGIYEAYNELIKHYSSKAHFNQKKAEEIYKKAIASGYYKITSIMGDLYMNGVFDGGKKSAIKCFKLGFAKKDIDATYALGWLYLQDSKTDEALKYFMVAAENGSVQSMRTLGRLYLYSRYGVQLDMEKAFAYLSAAAEKGDRMAYASLGDYYESKGEFLDMLKSHEKAARMGVVSSQVATARFYLEGKIVEKDAAKGIQYLRYAESKKDPKATLLLGYVYYYGDGVEKNDKTAFEYFQKSAEMGYFPAKRELAIFYREGIYVDQDFAKAISITRDLAEHGDIDSQYQLAVYLSNIKGHIDYIEAQSWLEIASTNGHESAKTQLHVIKENFDENELSQVSSKVKKIKKILSDNLKK